MGMIKEVDFSTLPRLCTEDQVREGARNLLINGCEIGRGTEVVILNERGLVDPAVANIIEQETRALGASVYVMWADGCSGPDDLPGPVMAAIKDCDVAVMNHLIAAILRLVPFAGSGLKMLNFLTRWNDLGSAFARVPYRVGLDILGELGRRTAGARAWRMTCPLGTDLQAGIPRRDSRADSGSGTGDSFTLRSFPLSVSAVFDALNASGRLAIRWITPSTTRVLKSTGVILPDPVVAIVDHGRMVDFEGPEAAVSRLRAYLDQVGEEVGKNGYIVNSWHAGTHPGCCTDITPQDDFFSWILLAHGNPRVAHFHVIGAPVPGEGSVPVVDPTITFDGTAIWDRGRLNFLDEPGFRARISSYCDPEQALHPSRQIGV